MLGKQPGIEADHIREWFLKPFKERIAKMDHEGLFVSERIKEVTMMCGREQSIYDQISSFGIALYVLGFFEGDDIMSIDDIDSNEAASLLKKHFTHIRQQDLPSDYHITTSREKYLVVIGDPSCPKHFAVLVDTCTRKSFFSKLRYFGCGFDSLEELISDFIGEDGLSYQDIHYFRKNHVIPQILAFPSKIYIVKDDSEYLVCDHN
jgi:hypothetical protein